MNSEINIFYCFTKIRFVCSVQEYWRARFTQNDSNNATLCWLQWWCKALFFVRLESQQIHVLPMIDTYDIHLWFIYIYNVCILYLFFLALAGTETQHLASYFQNVQWVQHIWSGLLHGVRVKETVLLWGIPTVLLPWIQQHGIQNCSRYVIVLLKVQIWLGKNEKFWLMFREICAREFVGGLI